MNTFVLLFFYNLVGLAYIQYCMKIWQSKKFVRIGSHTICQSLKKGACPLVERNASNTRSQYFETRLWHRDRWWTNYMAVSRWAKSNKSSSHTKLFQANGIVPIERCRIVNSEWYTTICLSVVFQEITEPPNRRRRITLHHDNASSYTSVQTTAFLSTENIDLMSHPPYSPDLAPNDFFSVLKK